MFHTQRRIVAILLLFAFIVSMSSFSVLAWEEPRVNAEYEALFPVPNTVDALGDGLSSVSETQDTVLNGKSIMFLGDSFFAGYGLSDFTQTWCHMLSSQYGMTYTKRSVSGSTFTNGGTWGYGPGKYYYPICSRELPAGNFDVILLEGSGNDWYCEAPLGTDLTSRDTTTLMGAVNVTIDRLQEAYPDALILFMTPWNTTGEVNGLGYTTQDYVDACIKVCEARNILYFEACDPSLSGIDASSAAFRSQYFLTSTDRWHLNAAGHQLYLPTIASWLESMLLEHYVVSGFYDVKKSDWYADAVQYSYDHGLVLGVTNTTFAPNTTMSRGMLVTVLYRAAGSPDVTDLTHPFEDIPEDAYYLSALLWGYNNGIIQGISDTQFAPTSDVTREQLVTFLYRFAGAEGTDYPLGDLSGFTDGHLVSEFAQPAVRWAIGTDVLHGMGDGTLQPQGCSTRAQAVQLLTNYFSKLES